MLSTVSTMSSASTVFTMYLSSTMSATSIVSTNDQDHMVQKIISINYELQLSHGQLQFLASSNQGTDRIACLVFLIDRIRGSTIAI